MHNVGSSSSEGERVAVLVLDTKEGVQGALFLVLDSVPGKIHSDLHHLAQRPPNNNQHTF